MVADTSSLESNGHDAAIHPGSNLAQIHRVVAKTRLLLRSTWIATGISLALGVLLTALIIVSVSDLAFAFGTPLRLIGLLSIILPTAWFLYVGVLRPLLIRLTRVAVARRIEREIPGIHNRLINCVDFGQRDSQSISVGFYRRLLSEAIDRIRDFRIARVLNLLGLRRAGMFAGVSILTFAGLLLAFSFQLPTAMARIFLPFADIPPASSAVYEVLVGDQTHPGDYETLRGNDVPYTVVLKAGDVDPPGGEDALRLEVLTSDRDGAEKVLSYEFDRIVDGRTSFTLTGMQHSFSYRVYGGGTWTKEYQVVMLDRPQIVQVQSTLHYPQYTLITEPIVNPPQSLDVEGPRQSDVEVAVRVAGDAIEGEIQLLEYQTKFVPVADRSERVWFYDSIPQGAKSQGKWVWTKEDERTFGPSHSNPASEKVQFHGFHSAPIGFEIEPGELLFADVFIDPEKPPEAIMIEWHDGENWEHRAFWGADKIGRGKVESAARRSAGPMPAAGQLVRLQVDSATVGLNGRRIRGINLMQFAGNCVWGKVGAMPPAQRPVRELVVVESFLLNQIESNTANPDGVALWRGSFPLTRSGFYRVELRNKLGYPNRAMQEGKVLAIRDQSPLIRIERPKKELVVSAAVKVPVYIWATDDYGLEETTLSIQNSSGGFEGWPVKRMDGPIRTDWSIATIDLAQLGLSVGDTLLYRAEVRDRLGQSASTEDHTIRIAEDNSAEDRKLSQFDQQTGSLLEKVERLITEQKKVQHTTAELSEKHAALTEQIADAQRTREAAAKADPDANSEPLALPPAAQKQLEKVRGELTAAGEQQQQNTRLGEQISSDLKQLAEQAPQLQLLPQQIAQQLQGVEGAFNELAVEPMKQLEAMMNAGARPETSDPQLPAIQQQSDQVAQNLDDLKQRLDALAKAQRQSQSDPNAALAELRQDMLQQDAGIAARNLEQLADFIKAMRQDLDELQGDQKGLIEDAAMDLSERLFENLQQVQGEVDEQSQDTLDEVGELLDQMREMRREEQIPAPELAADQQVPQSLDPAAPPSSEQSPPRENSPFTPALGGTPPTPNRELQKRREMLQRQQAKAKTPGAQARGEFREAQLDNAEQLDQANQALQSDQQTLEELTNQLQQAGSEPLSPEQAEALAQLMSSSPVQQAVQMLNRMLAKASNQKTDSADGQNQEDQSNPETTQAKLLPPGQLSPMGNLSEITGGEEIILVELEELDLITRGVIMKMQPKVREQLLQALRQEGPEGYREFIRDYFQRLTKAQATSEQ